MKNYYTDMIIDLQDKQIINFYNKLSKGKIYFSNL